MIVYNVYICYNLLFKWCFAKVLKHLHDMIGTSNGFDLYKQVLATPVFVFLGLIENPYDLCYTLLKF